MQGFIVEKFHINKFAQLVFNVRYFCEFNQIDNLFSLIKNQVKRQCFKKAQVLCNNFQDQYYKYPVKLIRHSKHR